MKITWKAVAIFFFILLMALLIWLLIFASKINKEVEKERHCAFEICELGEEGGNDAYDYVPEADRCYCFEKGEMTEARVLQ